MDSLFIMQRYWGSDDENNNNEKIDSDCNVPNKKRKFDKVDIDDNSESHTEKQDLTINEFHNDNTLFSKNQELESSVIEINDSSYEQPQDPSVNETNCDIFLIDVKGSNFHENTDKITFNLKEKIQVSKKKSPKKGKKQIFNDTKVQDNVNIVFSKNEELESPVIEIDDSNDFSYKQPQDPSVNETDCDIFLIDVKGSNSLEITGNSSNMKENIHVGQKSSSKKNNKQKLNNTKVQDYCKNFAPLENASDLQVKENTSNSQETENADETFCTIGHVHHQNDIKIKHALPYWLINPTYISANLMEEETPISELNYLDSNTKNNLKNAGISYLFPVQLAVIPWLMQSKEQSLVIRPSDICVSAPTGSGKTLAFVLPIVQSLKDRVVCAIRALIVLPVSELAIQVYKVFERYIHGTDLKVALLTGQKSFIAEQNALVKSKGQKIQNLVDIVVTTPGRIHDHIYRTKGFCLKRLRYLVIDEADRMMKEIHQGWLKQVEDAVFQDCDFASCICSSLKRTPFEPSSAFNFGFISQPLQKLLYSATLTHDPEQLHSLSLYKPKLFTATSTSSDQEYTGTCVIPSGLTMLQVVCKEGIKPMVICHLIKQHNFKRVLCFTETTERAHRLHLVLEEMGLLQVREISSFNRAIQRKIVLQQFQSGKVDILVCSDLVARGIDIENIDCVVSYDVPQFIKMYIHRIGRTARAGKTGTAITLLSEGEIPKFKRMLKPVGIEIPKQITISAEDLKPLVNSYQTALTAADTKLKKEKIQVQARFPKKAKVNDSQ